MSKRFIKPDWKKLRLLKPDLQRVWFYIWDKCDEIGVYHFDFDYMKLDLSLKINLNTQDLSTLPDCEILPENRVLIKNFIEVNYTVLKPDYNPHKPAYRDLLKNRLNLNSSLNQACFKLEEEDKDKEEDEEEDKDKVKPKKKSEKLEVIFFRENIKLTPIENEKLVELHGQEFTDKCYDHLSSFKIEKGYTTKSDYLTIGRWVVDAVTKKMSNGHSQSSGQITKPGTSEARTNALPKW